MMNDYCPECGAVLPPEMKAVGMCSKCCDHLDEVMTSLDNGRFDEYNENSFGIYGDEK